MTDEGRGWSAEASFPVLSLYDIELNVVGIEGETENSAFAAKHRQNSRSVLARASLSVRLPFNATKPR